MQYYKNLIKELRDNNIEPLATLYHWDIPIALDALGGFMNESIVDWFGNYARVCFREFGDNVKYWNTFNEPSQFCNLRKNDSAVRDYLCVHHMLKAHAKAYHIYGNEFRAKQRGMTTNFIIDLIFTFKYKISRFMLLIF